MGGMLRMMSRRKVEVEGVATSEFGRRVVEVRVWRLGWGRKDKRGESGIDRLGNKMLRVSRVIKG